ncbi:MAG: roadblock/LC7 domain-containing protein [Chthoniobacterales bacterium]
MTIPFLQYFKKSPKVPTAAPQVQVAPPAPKAEGDRMSKTVMPNTTRTVGLQDAVGNLDIRSTPTPAPRAAISFGGSSASAKSYDLPPAVALALEPRVERTISLQLQDVVSNMPEGLVRPLENAKATHSILLKASEVERGMAQGKPSVSVWTVFQQVPEVFMRTIASDETTEVILPLQKVMEQFSKLHVRADQSCEQAVPQLETPFLKVTLEDDARFGTVTPMRGPDAEELPPVRVELATAATLAAAEPEAKAGEKFVVTALPAMRFPAPRNPQGNGSDGSNGNGAAAAAPVEKPAAPARIPFKIAPKGTDASAPERVPASSGPSVPTRIPFKISAPSEEARPKAEPWLTKGNFAGDEESAPKAPCVALLLKPILQNVMPQQLARDLAEVPDDVRMEIPFSLVEPQLAAGRVSLLAGEFAHYLPEQYRDFFDSTTIDAPVVLPLQEVLKNLPGASLQVRADQVQPEIGENFVTPFSAKAEEDAKRFQNAPGPVAQMAAPMAAPATVAEAAAPVAKMSSRPTPSPVAPAPAVAAPAAPAPVAPAAKHADEEIDAKAAVAKVAKMAGVKACAIMFGDGLALAGDLPAEYEAEGLCAMAPSFLSRIQDHMVETKLGALQSMTLQCAGAAVTFFMHENLCLAAMHEKEALSAEIRERLARVLLELSRKYSHPA